MDKRFKHYPIEAPTFTERKMSFVISTAGVDRDNDTIDPKGWQLANYLKNPVVLFAHDYASLPVAKATRLEQMDKGLSAEIEFPPFGTYAFADTVHDMLKAGFLSATSVGFKPSKHEVNNERKGYDFTEQELLEFSIVPVPSNPEALVTQRHASVDTAIVKAWCKDITEWAAKQLDDAPARKAVEAYLSEQVAWKDFARDYAVESDGKALEAPRLVKLLQLHKLIPGDAKEARLHPDDLKAITALVKTEQAEELEVVQGEVEDLEIEITERSGGIEIDDDQFKRLMQQCVQATVSEVVADGVRTACRKLQGKVD